MWSKVADCPEYGGWMCVYHPVASSSSFCGSLCVSADSGACCPLSWLPGEPLILVVVPLTRWPPGRRSGHSFQHSSNPLTSRDPRSPLLSWCRCSCLLSLTAVISAK